MTAQQSVHVRNIALDIVFTLLTCGLYNVYVNYKQIQAVNSMLNEQKYDFWPWLIFTILTCGLYHIYHEYRMSTDLKKLLNLTDNTEIIIAVVMLALGLTPVADAIQQHQINRFHGNEKV